MGASRACACAVASAIAAAGCIDIPPPPGSSDGPVDGRPPDAEPCLPGDGDCDGWPAVSPTNPAANDCDDDDPAINPGELDDTDDGVDQDCADGSFSGTGLAGTSYSTGRLRADDVSIAFDTDTGMPSSMQLVGIESLHAEPGGCEVTNEEGLGISLYPTYAAHVRSDPMINGTVTVERVGPAVTTVLVAWTKVVPMVATGIGCNVAVTLAAQVRFHAMPGGRIHREDRVTVLSDEDASTCSGCASAGTMPIFTSYVSLEPTMDTIEINEAGPMDFQTYVGTSPPPLPAADTHRVCLSSQGDGRKLGVVWHFDPGAMERGIRIRTTTNPSSTLVYDWRRSEPLQARTYRAITAMFAQDTGGDCSDEMWEQMAEHVSPANSGEVAFNYERGLYVPTAGPLTGDALAFDLQGNMDRGFGVRLEGLGARGVTVWRDAARMTAHTGYLVQRDVDGAYIVWIPAAVAGEEFVIAGPGGEPAPP